MNELLTDPSAARGLFAFNPEFIVLLTLGVGLVLLLIAVICRQHVVRPHKIHEGFLRLLFALLPMVLALLLVAFSDHHRLLVLAVYLLILLSSALVLLAMWGMADAFYEAKAEPDNDEPPDNRALTRAQRNGLKRAEEKEMAAKNKPE